MPAVLVLGRGEVYEGTIGAARPHDRDLAIEIDEGFEHRFLPADCVPRLAGALWCFDAHLPLTVVAECRRFENCRTAEFRDSALEILRRTHLAKRRDRKPCVLEESLLPDALLRCVQHGACGANGGAAFGCFCGIGGHVLKLERHYADVAREFPDGIEIVVRRDHLDIGDLAGGCVLIGRKGVNAVTHAAGRDCEHAAQLPASEHADGGAGQNGLDHASTSARTLAACSSRNARSFSRSTGSWLARIATASSAAFCAPAFPMASVPTGMPPGICTIDRSESIPLSAWLSMGTPSTGNNVFAETIPGR